MSLQNRHSTDFKSVFLSGGGGFSFERGEYTGALQFSRGHHEILNV